MLSPEFRRAVYGECRRDVSGERIVHAVSYPMGTRDSFPGGKAAGS